MNAVKLFTTSVAALISIGVVSQAAQAQGKSRKEVRQELIQAQHDGTTQNSKTSYPLSAAAIARNKELHVASRHAGETTPEADHHDSLVAR